MFVYIFIVLLGSVSARFLEDSEYHQLPDLYHLDKYEECLDHPDGLYCLGIFHVKSARGPSKIYDYMVEYAEETHTFNRTLLHRGYCVSSRCPQNGTHNMTERFQNCAAEQLKTYPINIELIELHYCHRAADDRSLEMPNIGQLIYLTAVCVLVMLNVVGTLYDLKSKDNPKKIQVLLAWSVIANWKLLTSSNKAKQSSLTALHGVRVCIAIGTCLSHAALIYYTVYLNRPRILENISRHPLSMFLQNSTAMEQMFVVMSGFLFAFQLRKYSLKQQVSFKLIPLIIIKRIFRLLPVTVLVVGFAATWWPAISSGPIWSATVGAESEICKNKFWSHVFFVNNLYEANKLCVMPTWYMAVDVQMQIMATIIMVCLLQFASGTLLVLGILFVLSCLLNAALSYFYDWIPMLYLTVSPENLRTLFLNVPSFSGLYISPWGSMPSCFLGLILGYVYFGVQDAELNINKNYKWLLNIACVVSFVLMFSWVLLGYFIQNIKIKLFMVAYAAMERSIFQILMIVSYVVASVVCGFLVKLLAWRGWHALSRLSLPVMMVHWLVNIYLVGSTPQTMSTSVRDIGIYGVTTAVYTFIFSVPITILVEMPMKKLFDLLGP